MKWNFDDNSITLVNESFKIHLKVELQVDRKVS